MSRDERGREGKPLEAAPLLKASWKARLSPLMIDRHGTRRSPDNVSPFAIHRARTGDEFSHVKRVSLQ